MCFLNLNKALKIDVFYELITLTSAMLPPGFEPESMAREAMMIGRYTTGAK